MIFVFRHEVPSCLKVSSCVGIFFLRHTVNSRDGSDVPLRYTSKSFQNTVTSQDGSRRVPLSYNSNFFPICSRCSRPNKAFYLRCNMRCQHYQSHSLITQKLFILPIMLSISVWTMIIVKVISISKPFISRFLFLYISIFNNANSSCLAPLAPMFFTDLFKNSNSSRDNEI